MEMGTSTSELQQIGERVFHLHQLTAARVLFLGVSPSNRLPTVMLLNAGNREEVPHLPNGKAPQAICCILNVEPEFMGGSHWVAFFREIKSNILEFFDSYGKAPSYYGFRLPSFSKVHNHYQMQSNTSTVCGEYCVLFLFFRSCLLAKTNANVLAHSPRDRFKLSIRKLYFLRRGVHSRDNAVRSLIQHLSSSSAVVAAATTSHSLTLPISTYY